MAFRSLPKRRPVKIWSEGARNRLIRRAYVLTVYQVMQAREAGAVRSVPVPGSRRGCSAGRRRALPDAVPWPGRRAARGRRRDPTHPRPTHPDPAGEGRARTRKSHRPLTYKISPQFETT